MESIWDIINVPMGYLLRFLNDIVGNQYILALLLFAVVVEIILIPFGIKQQKNSIRQAKMRPKEEAIRKRYKGRDDAASKQRMSQEIQEMYQKEGFNPMGGCLPMLIQFPIIIALYNIVLNPLKYICGLSSATISQAVPVVNSFGHSFDAAAVSGRNIDLMAAIKNIIAEHGVEPFSAVEGFAEHIASVEDIPSLSMFGGAIDLAATPAFTNFNWLLLVPVLTFVAYFLSTKVNRKLMYQPAQNDAAMGCSNKVMDYAMPLMSVFITFGVPAALGVYWIFKCIVGMLKQVIIHLFMPIPKMTDEELKAAEKEYDEKAPKMPARESSGKKVRSLHYIDEEDYEDVSSKNKSEKKSAELPEKKDLAEDNEGEKQAYTETVENNSLLGHAPLKEDAPEKKSKKSKKDDKN